MPRRRLLTVAERESLLAFPATDDELIRRYAFSEPDLSVIQQRRGQHNRFGFAVQLCYLRYPGIALPTDAAPPASLLALIGQQLSIHSLNAKGNFSFDRAIPLDRSRSVLDLRLKR